MSHNRYVILDGLRGIAALAVVAFHSRELFPGGHLFDHANLAVDFFFMLSGFVITLAYQKEIVEGLAFTSFLRIRLIRLYPLYLAGLVMGTVAWAGKSHMDGNGVENVLIPFASMLVFLPALVPLASKSLDAFPLNSPAWSLSFEMLASISFFFLAKVKSLYIAIFSAAMLVWLIYEGTLGGFSYDTLIAGLPRIGFSFSAGILLYRFFALKSRRYQSTYIGVVAFCILAAILLLVFSRNLYEPESMVYSILMIVFVFPLVILAGASVQVSGSSTNTMELLGNLSYPIYIMHYPILVVLKFILKQHPIWVIPSSLILTVVIGYIALRFYDQPLRRALKRLGKAGDRIAVR